MSSAPLSSPSWLKRSFWPAKALALLATVAVIILFWREYQTGKIVLPVANAPPPQWAASVMAEGARWLGRWALLLVPAFLLGWWRKGRAPLSGVAFAALAGAVLATAYDASLHWPQLNKAASGEAPATDAYLGKLALVAFTILSVPLLLWLYRRSSLMSRYLAQAFFLPFGLCLFGLVSILIIMDMANNFNDFGAAKLSGLEIFLFYVVISPQMFVQIMALALLLAALYSLSKMSRSNEIISMLGAGKSLFFILRPVLVLAFFTSLWCLTLNYYWAPRAEGLKDSVLNVNEDLSGGTKAQAVFYREPEARRTWFVGRVPVDFPEDPKERMREVEIREQDENGNLTRGWRMRRVGWRAATNTWLFADGMEITYPSGGVQALRPLGGPAGAPMRPEEIKDWPETPWKIFSGSLNPEVLSVPELFSYMRAKATPTNADALAPFRAQLSYRFSVAATCFLVAFMAAPMGVAYSRRGALGGIAVALVIFFILLFLDAFFLSLGKSLRIEPYLSVWIPLMLVAFLGCILFWYRSRNREFPSLNPFKLFRRRRGAR